MSTTDPRLDQVLVSPNESDRNGEPANIVDALFAVARGLHDLAAATRNTEDEQP